MSYVKNRTKNSSAAPRLLWESEAMDEDFLDVDYARDWEDLDTGERGAAEWDGFPVPGSREKALDARRRIERRWEREELQSRLQDVFDELRSSRRKIRRRRRSEHWLC